MNDLWLMAMISGFVATCTWAACTGYYTARVWDVKRDCVKQLQLANKELIEMRNMHIAYGDIPIERLIGLETFDPAGEEEQ